MSLWLEIPRPSASLQRHQPSSPRRLVEQQLRYDERLDQLGALGVWLAATLHLTGQE
ncbi:MAG: hypothetical protein ACJ797_20890 [Ktedonobacteraceae bacterium]